ncbi:MAG: class I SAM-dependent methyltransferase [Pseudomonadota bacterium]|jgi:hypothetical protein
MSNLFQGLDIRAWCEANGLYALFNHDPAGVDPTRKLEKGIYETVDPDNHVPFPPEFDDLARLHFLARTRRVTTVLEIGAGKSTVVLADAMRRNQAEYGEYVKANLRRANPFEVHTLDQSAEWIEVCRRTLPAELTGYVHFQSATVRMTTFNGRACTLYSRIPNVCPDLIYLDGPDQFAVEGDVHGISTRSADRLPMSADLLLLEPFLLPGTLIVVDGRTANARFLRNNFQRPWRYAHHVEADLHTFELVEPPLGKLNERQIRFCLGDGALVSA